MCVASPFSVYLCCLSPVLFLYLWEKCLLSRPFVPFFFVYSFSRLPMEFEALLRTTTSCMNKNNIILQLRTCYLNGNIFCRITRLGVDYHRSKCCHSIVLIMLWLWHKIFEILDYQNLHSGQKCKAIAKLMVVLLNFDPLHSISCSNCGSRRMRTQFKRPAFLYRRCKRKSNKIWWHPSKSSRKNFSTQSKSCCHRCYFACLLWELVLKLTWNVLFYSFIKSVCCSGRPNRPFILLVEIYGHVKTSNEISKSERDALDENLNRIKPYAFGWLV